MRRLVRTRGSTLQSEPTHVSCYDERRGAGLSWVGQDSPLLASETHAAYIDNRPLLVPGKPETRQYKAMFFIGKSEIGLMSATVTAIAAP